MFRVVWAAPNGILEIFQKNSRSHCGWSRGVRTRIWGVRRRVLAKNSVPVLRKTLSETFRLNGTSPQRSEIAQNERPNSHEHHPDTPPQHSTRNPDNNPHTNPNRTESPTSPNQDSSSPTNPPRPSHEHRWITRWYPNRERRTR
jgi:hypothetical protein